VKKRPTVEAALEDGIPAARKALAVRLATLVDQGDAPAYVTIQAARALAALLVEMESVEEPRPATYDVERTLDLLRN
jgi:hypothetical protein